MKNILLLFLYLSLSLSASAIVSKTINLTNAGTLSSTLTAAELTSTTNLTVSGKIDARDFKTMRDAMPVLEEIDLSGASILAYTGIGGTNGNTSQAYPINEIPSYAFSSPSTYAGKTSLKSIILPQSTTAINSFAFYNCTGLTGNLNLPPSLQYIGNGSFNGCIGLSGNLNLPATLNYIGYFAFYGCVNFTGSLIIPSSVTYIGNNVFASCTGFNEGLIIPSSVIYLYNAFQNCVNIKYVFAKSINPIDLSADIDVFDGIDKSTCLLYVPKDSKIKYKSAPQWKDFVNIIEINDENDINNNSKIVSITAGTLSTFLTVSELSTITNLTITGEIDARDFLTMRDNMPMLEEVDLKGASIIAYQGVIGVGIYKAGPYDANAIPKYAFFNPSNNTTKPLLSKIVLPYSTNFIDDYAFCGTGLSAIYSYSSTPPLIYSSDVFVGVNKTSCNLYVPFGSSSLYKSATQWKEFNNVIELQFEDNIINSKTVSITAGNLSSTLTTGELISTTKLIITGNIDARDFKTMRDAMPVLEEIDLSGASILAYTGTDGTNGTSSQNYPINEIPQNAFCNPSTFNGKTSLRTFVFPELINSIGQNAFKNCKYTNAVLIPSTVSNISVGAFNRFSGLINVDSNNITYSSIDGVLFSKDKTTLIQCATSKAGNYTIPSSVVIISAYAFDNCINLTGDLNLPSSLTTIGRYAFNECKGFDGNLIIPSSVTSIDVGAFYKCSGFTGALNIPSSLNKISDSVFYGCSGFTGTLNIPYSITHISSGAFWGCSGLSGTVTIPSSVTWLGNGVFSFCSKLVGMSIPSSVTHIGSNLLYNCSGLTSLTAFSNTPISFVDPIYGNSTNVFTGVNKSICILYVPANTKTKYSNALQWKDFLNIVEMPSTSIKTELENSITIFPNPVSTSFQINGIVDIAQVTLLDLDGKVLIVQSVSNGESILISNLPNAVYIVSIATKRGTFYRKISKL
jgi:hypothetical protein